MQEAKEQGTGKSMTRRLAWRLKEDPEIPGTLMATPMPSLWQRVQPGDRLWVKETFIHYREKCKESSTGFVDWLHYRSTDENDFYPGMKWKPSIYMPRIHSRLTLVVTATKIERLRTISEQDCEREGLVWVPTQKIWGVKVDGGYSPYGLTAQECFMHLFCDLHGPSIWRDNPEVVAIAFQVHKHNIYAMPKEIAA